jgi:hypothetical protein
MGVQLYSLALENQKYTTRLKHKDSKRLSIKLKLHLLYLLYMIDKNRSPPPSAFILDKYEQQIEDDIEKGLYVPVSDDDVAYFLKT